VRRYPVDHVDHRVRSLASVSGFYDALLPALGYTKRIAGRTMIEYYHPDEADPFFGIHQRAGHVPSLTRVAFAARTRADVDRIGALLASIGARNIEGPMECQDDGQPYYAVFFEDPDGNKLEVTRNGLDEAHVTHHPFDHIDHRVRSLASVSAFYDALMPALGYTKRVAGQIMIEYYHPDEADPFFGIHQHAGHSPSLTRVAFAARTRVDVDRIGALLESIGARKVQGPMDCADYRQPYYAVFFEDPEGNRLEVCCRRWARKELGTGISAQMNSAEVKAALDWQ
jgi:predicted lactoylglutathione lyase